MLAGFLRVPQSAALMRSFLLAALALPSFAAAQPRQPALGTRSAPIVTQDGLRFRDLNRSGALDPYEDWRLAPDVRARDLVARMTLEEKAGAMMHGTARTEGPMGGAGIGARYDTAGRRAPIGGAKVTSMLTRLGGDPATLAAEHDALQAIAESTRLGVPVTVSTDPRHHFQYVLGASVQSGGFSQWPEPLGFAALGDAALMRRFADIARQEYRAVGIHMSLSPQADLATEPRWSRINGTFGEDADLAGRLVRAYVEGFQHGARGVDTAGVVAVVKHWVGYGAQKDGFDSHSAYGKIASFPGRTLDYHVRPFLGAFAAGVAGVMPTYSILEGAMLDGKPVEQVGAGYNAQLLTGLLRGRHRFDGIVLTDWAVTNDCTQPCREGAPAGERPSFASVAMPWGVEALPKQARFVKAVQAGVDQFGGTEEGGELVRAVRAGALPESRLDASVRRIVRQKFALGLFENPYADTARARTVVGRAGWQAAALDAQRRALVLLENRKAILPLKPAVKRVYLHSIDSALAKRYGWTVATDPSQADVAIMRVTAPFQTLHPQYVFGAMQHEGDLGFREGDSTFAAIQRVSAAVPTIVTVYLDRPAILGGIRDRVAALVGNFGVSDEALLDVLAGRARPEGRLPFELPSSMAAVQAQRPDLPHDSARPLYRFGYGMRY